MNKAFNKIISSETISAIFIIAIVGMFIFANFFTGFNLYLFAIVMLISASIAFCFPRSALFSIIFLTFVFERQFTLQAIIFGRNIYKLYPLDILMVAMILGIFFQIICKKISIKPKKVDLLLILFSLFIVVYFCISTFALGNNFDLAFSSFKNYIFYSLLYFATFLLIDKKERLHDLFKFALAGGIMIIIFILIGIGTGSGLWTEYTPLTTSGSRILAATHAYFLSFVILTVIARAVVYEKWTHRAFIYLIPIWIIGIIGSLMRNIWLGLFIAIAAIYALVSQKQRKFIQREILKITIVLIAIFAVAGYLTILFPNSDFSQEIQKITGVVSQRANSISLEDDSVLWRYVVWNATFNEFIKNPILGLGFGKTVFVEIEKYNFKALVELRDIHNSFFVLLAQTGIVVFSLFVWIVFLNIKSLFKKAKKGWEELAMIAIMVFFLVIFQFQPYLETNITSIFFWISLGIIRSLQDNE